MSDIILASPYPDAPLFRRSIFTHVLGSTPDAPHLVGGFPATSPAFIDEPTGIVLTRGAVREYALQLAYSLHNLPAPLAHSSQPHPPIILVFSPNNIVWPILVHAVAAAGIRATFANAAYTPKELAFQYVDTGAHLILVHPTLAHVVQDTLRSIGCTESEIRSRVILLTSYWLTRIPDSVSAGLAHFTSLDTLMGRGSLPNEVSFDGERSNETLFFCYSSGTTGNPKGVETSHYNLTSVIEILRTAWPKVTPCLTPSLPEDRTGPQPDVFYANLPYYHMYGVNLLLVPFSLGAPTVLGSGFHPERFCQSVERYRMSILMVVPPMLVALVRLDAFERYNMSSVRILYSGAAPLGPELFATIQKRLQKVGANTVVVQAYGLTESTSSLTLLDPAYASSRFGSVGRVLPNHQIRLARRDGDEIITNTERAGEIWFRGPMVMKGYLNNPSATADAFSSDGWFKTGDIAVADKDGFLTIIDRRKELIKYKGFQVPPAELEALLLQHPDIADAAVIGVESIDEATELPRAYVVPARPVPPHEAVTAALQVQAWVSDRAAAHKRLRGGIIFVDEIPKSASGKILRRVLRERAKGEVGHGQITPRTKL